MPARRDWLLAVVCALQFTVVADANAMAIALPSAGRAFGADAAGLQWVLSAYTLCFGAALLVGGRIADIWGRRRMLVLGCAALAAAATTAASAPSLTTLVLARGAQGVAAAIATPAALALLTSRRPPGRARSRDVSAFGSMVAIGFVAGVVGGGWLIGSVGWRAVPAMTVPLAALVMISVLRRAPPDLAPRRGATLPVVSPLLLASALVAFAYPLSRTGDLGWRSPQLVGGLVAASALGVVLVLRERATHAPLIPGRSLRSTGMRAGLAGAVLALATSAGGTYALALYLQDVLGYTPLATGSVFLAFGLGGVAGGALGRQSVARVGAGGLLVGGLLAQALGCLFLATMSATPTGDVLFVGMTLIGFGNVLATVTFTIVALADTPVEDHGAASGLLSTAQQVGATMGLAVAGGIIAGSGMNPQGLAKALVGCAAMSALGAVLVWLILISRRMPMRGAWRSSPGRERAAAPGVVDHRAGAHDE